MDKLTSRQARYVSFVVSGLSEADAARQAGYGRVYSKGAASQISTRPAVKRAIQQEQANLRKKCLYEVEHAVEEIDRAIAFGYKRSNPMSIAKLLDLKCRIFGLLVEKIDLNATTIDLKGALEAAKLRVITALHINPFEEPPPAPSLPPGAEPFGE